MYARQGTTPGEGVQKSTQPLSKRGQKCSSVSKTDLQMVRKSRHQSLQPSFAFLSRPLVALQISVQSSLFLKVDNPENYLGAGGFLPVRTFSVSKATDNTDDAHNSPAI